MLNSPSKFLLAFALPLLLWQPSAFAHDSGYADCEFEYLARPKVTSFLEALKNENAPVFQKVQTILASRTKEQQYQIDQRLTQLHAGREMSFQVKNPVTGYYDKFVAVPSTGVVAAMRESDFDRIVQSTGPLMRVMRSMLQKIYSVHELTVESLGLQSLPKDEAELALRVIRDSIYLEPKMRDPVMKDYPFLSVAGFDFAIVDPTHPTPEFFEMNLGTPSGLANNFMLLESLRSADPELYNAIFPFLPPDDTFAKIRHAVESNAYAWTGRHGLTVAISPGSYNGAHPDVAMIAKMAGIPLVRSGDLYQDDAGNVRLDKGLGPARDPIVTGIYGRMEESYFLQSNAEGIPAINPVFTNDENLQKKLGVKLRPNVAYDFVYDDKSNIIDVNKDENGHPRYMHIWEKPQKGSFRDAILKRKLYYSAIGGRVLDDKRLARILTQYLIPETIKKDLARPIKSLKLSEYDKFYEHPKRFVVKDPGKSGGAGIRFPELESDTQIDQLIHDVKIHPGEYEIQYHSDTVSLPRLEVKNGQLHSWNARTGVRIFVPLDADGNVDAGPNSSLVRTSPESDFKDNTSAGGGYGILAVLRDQPRLDSSNGPDMSIPSLDSSAASALELIKHLEEDLAHTQKSHRPLATEVRSHARDLSFRLRELINVLDEGSRSVIPMLRDFADGHLVGSFADLFMHLDEIKNSLIGSQTRRPDGQLQQFIDESAQWVNGSVRDENAAHALEQIQVLENEIYQAVKSNSSPSDDAKTRARNLVSNLRTLIPERQKNLAPAMTILQNYADGRLPSYADAAQHLDAIKNYIVRLPMRWRPGSQQQKFIVENREWVQTSVVDPIEEQERLLPTKAVLKPLDQHEQTYKYMASGEWKTEVAEYVSVDDPIIQSVLDQVHAMGGEVRLLSRVKSGTDQTAPRFSWEPAYFWVNPKPFNWEKQPLTTFKPIISIDLTQDYALAALLHEFEHFKMWRQFYNDFRNRGLNHERACLAANHELGKTENWYLGEKLALGAETYAEHNHPNHPYMHAHFRKPLEYYEKNYVNRMMYPAFEAFNQELRKKFDKKKRVARSYSDSVAHDYMREMVTFAYETKEAALDYYKKRPGYQSDQMIDWLKNSTLFDLLARPYGIERLQALGRQKDFEQMLLKVCAERKIDQNLCVKKAEAVQLELPLAVPQGQ